MKWSKYIFLGVLLNRTVMAIPGEGLQDTQASTEKREAKNVVDLDQLIDALNLKDGLENLNDKREAKNVITIEELLDTDELGSNQNNKREARNVIDLDALLSQLNDERSESSKHKREARNLVDLDALFSKDSKGSKHKREARNLVDLDALFSNLNSDNKDSKGSKHKREARNLVDLDALFSNLNSDNKDSKGSKHKREARNLVDLDALFSNLNSDNKDSKGSKHKREARNLVDLDSLRTKLAKKGAFQKGSKSKVAGTVDHILSLIKQHGIDLQTLKIEEGANEEFSSSELSQEMPEGAVRIGNEEKANTREKIRLIFDIPERDTQKNVLTSVLPQLNSVSIFSGYLRDNADLAYEASNEKLSMLLVAPSNEAIANGLGGLKPWEFPNPLSGGEDDDQIVKANVNFFLEAHTVLDIEKNSQILDNHFVFSLVNGRKIYCQKDDKGLFKVSGDLREWIQVSSIKQVDNGYIFVIDGVLLKPSALQ